MADLEHQIPQVQETMLTPFEEALFEARENVIKTVVATQLGRTTKLERLAAREAIDEYANTISLCVDSYLTPVYESLGEGPEHETEEQTVYRSEYLVNSAVSVVARAVEGDIEAIHARVVEKRMNESDFFRGVEWVNTRKRAPLLGKLAVNAPAGFSAWTSASAVHEITSSNLLSGVGAIVGFTAVNAVLKLGVGPVVKSVTASLLGKKVERLIRPVSQEFMNEIDRREAKHVSKGGEKFSHQQRVEIIRALTIDQTMDFFHNEIKADIHDSMTDDHRAEMPTREEAVAIIQANIVEHLCEQFGLDFKKDKRIDLKPDNR